jgi:hypothetical protein
MRTLTQRITRSWRSRLLRRQLRVLPGPDAEWLALAEEARPW